MTTKNDEVEIISGNDKGVRGTVQSVLAHRDRIVVSGVNIVKKHQKPRSTGGRSQAQGGIIEFEAPIHVSNVMLVDPDSGELTRIGQRRDEDGHLVRFAKLSGTEID